MRVWQMQSSVHEASSPKVKALPNVKTVVPISRRLAATPFPGDTPAVRWPTRVGIFPGWLEPDDERVAELRRAFVSELESMGNVQVVGDVTLPDQWDELTSPPLGGSHGAEQLLHELRDPPAP